MTLSRMYVHEALLIAQRNVQQKSFWINLFHPSRECRLVNKLKVLKMVVFLAFAINTPIPGFATIMCWHPTESSIPHGALLSRSLQLQLVSSSSWTLMTQPLLFRLDKARIARQINSTFNFKQTRFNSFATIIDYRQALPSFFAFPTNSFTHMWC